ncbi:hypothetical protein S1OALGB6SA_2358 [Olavius algarvensis spirochete endosymbiont]|uniref:hypothetical protein n=1 Tax=Olavius algarvensis spirochete endosymbiont TaxID=260710 RepID=UPI00052C8716|nr:hypothetical protein [Olavius algarvensis spirochete endosymbiont]KGM43043.1 hypothetical protein JY97_09840 [Alkalispirochaeta odontotermitis]CAD7838800.1 MAG: hypothetical protein [Olavius algarvensis spirochete endosymbiont]VDB01256.1 hypothetical protein S1OALGB6SA_2358 [Olavius algarvensis spirochete endosymbiont]
MFQLYLLTVLTNILVGFALAREFISARFERFSEHTNFMNNGLYRIVLVAASILIGFINLFSIYPEDIAVLGDLLPSLAGIVAGILLLVDYLRNRIAKTETTEIAEEVEQNSAPYLSIVGIGSVIIGILHAVFPKAPLL